MHGTKVTCVLRVSGKSQKNILSVAVRIRSQRNRIGRNWLRHCKFKYQWRAAVMSVMYLRVPQYSGNFFTTSWINIFSSRTLFHGVRNMLTKILTFRPGNTYTMLKLC